MLHKVSVVSGGCSTLTFCFKELKGSVTNAYGAGRGGEIWPHTAHHR